MIHHITENRQEWFVDSTSDVAFVVDDEGRSIFAIRSSKHVLVPAFKVSSVSVEDMVSILQDVFQAETGRPRDTAEVHVFEMGDLRGLCLV